MALDAMRDELGLGLPAGLSLAIDVHQKGDAYEYAPGVYREGPITGLVVRGREKLVEGTTLKGRLWLAKGDADSPLGYVVGRYTEAQLPDGRHLPVCIVLADPTAQPGFPIREGAGDGVALTLRWGPATAVSRWP
jgi:serine/threonine-protein kinase